jgi:hypothetical protein
MEVIPTPVRHDLADTLRAVAFFAAAMFTQQFDNVMIAPSVHVLFTPNRDARLAVIISTRRRDRFEPLER